MRSPIEHELKTWPPFFGDVESGAKPFEVQKNDRDYRVGDTLYLREWRPDWRDYTGRTLRKRVTYVLHVDKLGAPSDLVVLGLSR